MSVVRVKGGSDIIEDCRTFVKLEGRLLPGQTYTSRAGRLPCKAVIHAVGPMWHGGRHQEENHLYAAVTQSMDEASHRGFTSMAIPAISTGIFGFPANRAVDIILTASRDYFVESGGTCLKEVHIVDNDVRVMKLFEAQLKQMTLPSGPTGGQEEDHTQTDGAGTAGRRLRAPANGAAAAAAELSDNASDGGLQC